MTSVDDATGRAPELRERRASSALTVEQAIGAVERTVARVIARLPSALPHRLLIAVSGGPDSVAALLALQRIGAGSTVQLAAAHLNHGVRGHEADRDEGFVRELCGRLKIELVVERAQGLKLANFEERARELRYEFLNRTAQALNMQYIVLGHHQRDQAETVLLRLLRGAGAKGLAAMAESGPGRLIRPLLSLDRTAILAYLEAIRADYVVDSSNLARGALRNRVRAELLPQLERDYWPGIGRRLAQLASEMREISDFMETEARRSLDLRLVPAPNIKDGAFWRMDVRGFALLAPALARATLREFLKRTVGDLRKIQRAHIDAMYRLATNQSPSGTLHLPRRWRTRRNGDTLVLENNQSPSPSSAADAANSGEFGLRPGLNTLSVSSLTLTLREVQEEDSCFPVAPWHPPNKFEAYFDAEEAPSLAIRFVRRGDRIRPLGFCGSQKLQDVFVDKKVTAARRGTWPLVVLNDEVIWIPGLVRSRVALVTPASRKVLHLCAHSLGRLSEV